jgi:hypothetical protein
MIFFGCGILSLASRSRWVLVSSTICRNVPAGPVNVPRVSSSSSPAILAQVTPVVVSATRMKQQGEPACRQMCLSGHGCHIVGDRRRGDRSVGGRT